MKSKEYITQLPYQTNLQASHLMDEIERLSIYYPEHKANCDQLAAAICAWRYNFHCIRANQEGSDDGK